MYNYCLKYSFTLKNKKSKHRLLLSFLLLFFSATRLYSLDTFQLEEVEWPLEYLTPISGTFTEYRNSSVHLGLDFKTYGINGLKLLSATKGYVESISYSPSGYGLSIITYSPNTRLKTRYAHLNDFKGSISGFELLRQSLLLLNEEKFSVRLNANEFQFKKKDWIARTGETGVGIAHLHLEIFDSKGFYNPMIFKNYSQIDKQYPIVNLVSIETDNGEMHYLKATQKKDNLFEIEETETPITVSGKVKVKVTAYDLISSINRNGIFGFTLKANEKELYTKNLDFLSYKELSEKHALYDINRSSLSPPNYVYNLFDGREEKNYSFNTNDFPLNEKILLNISVFDSNKNTSTIEFSVIVKESSPIQNKKVDTKIFLSDDSNVIINLKKNKIIGKGEIKIQKLNSLPESLQTDGLLPEGQSYEITAYDYSWLGKAEATLKIGNLSQGQSLYLYDKETKILNLLKTKSSKNGLSFELSRTGILVVMKDIVPPKIYYPYLIHRYFNPQDSIGENFIERFYSISDKGSGIGKMTVLFEGQSYPFEFDLDRQFIKIQIPKSLRQFKKHYLIQIQVADKVGNLSDWFTDLVRIPSK